MTKPGVKKNQKVRNSEPCETGCCKVEALITIDGRGQVVLPKEIRDKAGINAGDKLAVVSWERNGKVCCLSLQKAQDLEDMVKSMLGPVMKEILS